MMSIACVICIINVYLSKPFPRVYNNSNLCVLCVTLQKWRLKNKHTYIHTTMPLADFINFNFLV